MKKNMKKLCAALAVFVGLLGVAHSMKAPHVGGGGIRGGARAGGARFSGAHVSGARVSGARVSGARVSGARVSGARVSGARVGTRSAGHHVAASNWHGGKHWAHGGGNFRHWGWGGRWWWGLGFWFPIGYYIYADPAPYTGNDAIFFNDTPSTLLITSDLGELELQPGEQQALGRQSCVFTIENMDTGESSQYESCSHQIALYDRGEQ